MKLFISLFSILFLVSSCFKGESVDVVIHNAKVHTMDLNNTLYDAIAIKDGKIVEVGPERQILNKYSADEYIDAQLKDVFPGFTDAHGHIFSYAKQKLSVDLVGCRSFDELIVRIEKYQAIHNRSVIVGRGWDQSLWGDSLLPTNQELNRLFPNTPVCLFRIDGHALLANEAAIQSSSYEGKIDASINIDGGYIIYDDQYNPTGIFVDNAMNPILDIIPAFPKDELKKAIKDIQFEMLCYGVTGVHEAGIEFSELQLIEELIEEGELDVMMYAMLLPSEENIEFAQKNGVYTNQNLLVRSFKVYGDGALGSRGAYLKNTYSDHSSHQGYLTTPKEEMERISTICMETGYQMNTHAIGDSTNRVLLDLYASISEQNPDHRWRIEHAQVIAPEDFELFSKHRVLPSVQPTHAVSDQRWATDRLGHDRLNDGAYAYKSLIDQYGLIAIGTDFPVESIDPFRTIHAAINRKDKENYPSGGFLPKERISLEQCIRGMTNWAAVAAFQENETGTLEIGKDATLVIFDKQVIAWPSYTPNFAHTAFIKGKKVYSVE